MPACYPAPRSPRSRPSADRIWRLASGSGPSISCAGSGGVPAAAVDDDPEKGRVLSSLLQYMAGPGQSAASRLNYTPVPRDLRESVAAKIRLLHDPDGHLLGT
jgi:hypothetical protein